MKDGRTHSDVDLLREPASAMSGAYAARITCALSSQPLSCARGSGFSRLQSKSHVCSKFGNLLVLSKAFSASLGGYWFFRPWNRTKFFPNLLRNRNFGYEGQPCARQAPWAFPGGLLAGGWRREVAVSRPSEKRSQSLFSFSSCLARRRSNYCSFPGGLPVRKNTAARSIVSTFR